MNDPAGRLQPQRQRIEGRAQVLGEGMPIVRALPTRGLRTVGAWCFLDHFGPSDVTQGHGMRVGPHPHIGLQTVTWLLEGEILHRDSLGSVQSIRPGQLNLMTSGRGISHSEESPAPRPPRLHGAQFWVALPEGARHGEPAFEHHAQLPCTEHQGLQVTVLLGEAFGLRSPGTVYSPLVGMDVRARGPITATLPLRREWEYGFLVLEGAAELDTEALAPGILLYLGAGRTEVRLKTTGPVTAVLIGGAPFDEPLLMWWNFVGRSKDELVAASCEWNLESPRFGTVRGYDGPRIPAPLPPWSAP